MTQHQCPHCKGPFQWRPRKPRCPECDARRRAEYAALDLLDAKAKSAYRARWYKSGPARNPPVPHREMLDGAVPLAGKIFFFGGDPFLPARHRDALKSIL